MISSLAFSAIAKQYPVATIRKPRSLLTVSLPQYETRAHLYETLGLWMKHVAEDKFQVYLESLGVQQFQEGLRPQRMSLCRSLLQGLAQAMALPNPPHNCWTILCSTTEKIFTFLPNQIQVQYNCCTFKTYIFFLHL